MFVSKSNRAYHGFFIMTEHVLDSIFFLVYVSEAKKKCLKE